MSIEQMLADVKVARIRGGIRRTGVAVVLATTLGLLAGLPGSASAASCAVPGSTTRTHVGDLRIYSKNNSVYVCSTRYGKRIHLESHATNVDLYARIGRRTFAYAISHAGIFGSRNLKTGALLHRHVVSVDTDESAEQLVVKGDGSIAYIYSWIGSNSHDAGNTVAKDDGTGHRDLDSDCVLCDNSIDTSYLHASGGTVQWKDNGMIQTAPFM